MGDIGFLLRNRSWALVPSWASPLGEADLPTVARLRKDATEILLLLVHSLINLC